MFISNAMNNKFLLVIIFFFFCRLSHAEILPSSSAVIIESGKKESSIDIKNNGTKSVLLYSKVRKLPDDDLSGGTIYAEPQAILLAPGETQSIRLMYNTNTSDDKEHIARVTFTGLPPQEDTNEDKVKILIGQDLPIVVNMKKNIEQKDMWQVVKYSIDRDGLCIQNPSSKVFRFVPSLHVNETGTEITFSKPYVLPGEKLCATSTHLLAHGMHINIDSISDYNYQMKSNLISL